MDGDGSKVHQRHGDVTIREKFFFHASSLFGAQSSVSEVTHLFPGCLPSCAAVCLLFRPKRTLFFSPPPTHTHSQSILFILFVYTFHSKLRLSSYYCTLESHNRSSTYTQLFFPHCKALTSLFTIPLLQQWKYVVVWSTSNKLAPLVG